MVSNASGFAPPKHPPGPADFVEIKCTYGCNHRCAFCIWRSRRKSKSMRWRELRDNLRYFFAEASVGGLILSGGEPTLHPSFGRLLKFLAQDVRIRHFHLHTNATRIRRDDVQLLSGAAQCRSATIGLHSSDPSVYARIVGGKDDLAQALRGIEILLACGYELRASVVVLQDNVDHLVETTQFLLSLGFGTVECRLPIPGPDWGTEPYLLHADVARPHFERWIGTFQNDPRVRLNASAAFCFGSSVVELRPQRFWFVDKDCQFSRASASGHQLSSIWGEAFSRYRKSGDCSECVLSSLCPGFSDYEIAAGFAEADPIGLRRLHAAICG